MINLIWRPTKSFNFETVDGKTIILHSLGLALNINYLWYHTLTDTVMIILFDKYVHPLQQKCTEEF